MKISFILILALTYNFFKQTTIFFLQEFEPQSSKIKDYKIGICCFSAKHAALRRKSKDWLARNHVGLVQNRPHHHFIEN